MKKLSRFVFIIAVGLVLFGCSGLGPQRFQNTVPITTDINFTSSGKTIFVSQFEGWREKSLNYIYKISANDLKKSVKQALSNSSIFKRVTISSEVKSDYKLSANIVSQEQSGGFVMAAQLVVEYTISNNVGKTIFNEKIASSYSLSLGEGLDGNVRRRKTSEGALRENVRAFLQKTSEISF